MEPSVGHTDRVDGARQKHKRIEFAMGGLFLLLLSAAAITQSARSHYIPVTGDPANSRADSRNDSMESPNCPSQFPLSDRLVASVCFDDEANVIVDIRLFLNHKPTIKGVVLNEDEYFALGHLYDGILSAIRESRDGAEKPIHHADGRP